MTTRAPSPTKLREVLLYLLEQTAQKVDAGLVYVCCLLDIIDETYYNRHGEHLVRSIRSTHHFGPTPKELDRTIKQVIAEGVVREEYRKYFGLTQHKLIPVRPGAGDQLAPAERSVVDEELARFAGCNAAQVKRDGSWGSVNRYADCGEPVSPASALLSDTRAATRKIATSRSWRLYSRRPPIDELEDLPPEIRDMEESSDDEKPE